MAKRGSRSTNIPTLKHLGFGQPFSIFRRRKGDRRWRKVEYAALTRSSAARWERLVRAGRATRRRDGNLEGMLGFGITTVAEVQRRIRQEKHARGATV